MKTTTTHIRSNQKSGVRRSWIFVLPVIALFFSGCFSFSNMQSGRTLGKGTSEINLSAGYIGISDGDVGGSIPVFEFGGRYGVTDKTDVGLKLSNFGTAVGSVKYQFAGTNESQFAAATGFGIGGSFIRFNIDGDRLSFFQYEIPLHLSFHPSEKFGLVFTPRYVGVGGAFAGEAGLSHLLAFSPGIEFGKKFKLGIEFNMLVPITDLALSDGFFSQFGIGFRYAF